MSAIYNCEARHSAYENNDSCYIMLRWLLVTFYHRVVYSVIYTGVSSKRSLENIRGGSHKLQENASQASLDGMSPF
jgi:hypothetical protein